MSHFLLAAEVGQLFSVLVDMRPLHRVDLIHSNKDQLDPMSCLKLPEILHAVCSPADEAHTLQTMPFDFREQCNLDRTILV